MLGVDLRTRKIAWRYRNPNREFPFYSSAALLDGRVFVGGRDKSVHAINAATGKAAISALVYPAILLALALVLVSIIVLKVVPAFSDFYQQFGPQLPLATRIIVSVSSCAGSHFLVILVGRGRRVALWRGCGSPDSRRGSTG